MSQAGRQGGPIRLCYGFDGYTFSAFSRRSPMQTYQELQNRNIKSFRKFVIIFITARMDQQGFKRSFAINLLEKQRKQILNSSSNLYLFGTHFILGIHMLQYRQISRKLWLFSSYNLSNIEGMNITQRPSLLLSNKSSFSQSPSKRQTGWYTVKNEGRQAQAFRQITLLFNKNVNIISKSLKQLLGDVQVSSPYRPSSSQRDDIDSQRDKIYTQGIDKLAKCLLTRNSQARRAIQTYSTQYREKYNKPLVTIALEETSTKNTTAESRTRIRPISSKPLRQISRSLIMDNQKPCKDPPVNMEAVARFADIDSKQLPKFFGNTDYTSRMASAKLDKSNRSENPFSNWFDLGNPRASFLECTGQFLPSFGYKRTSSRAGSSASQSKRDQVADFRAKISVLKSDFQVKVAKQQQTYKKRQKEPSLFTNNLFI